MAKQAVSRDVTADAVTDEKPSAGSRLREVLLERREASIAIVAIALIAYFQSSNSAFLSTGNMRTLSEFIYPSAMIAAGLVMLLICGEIDLSVGQTFAFAPIVMYLADQELVLPIAIVIGLVGAALVGLANGLVTVYLRVPSFIATLGMLFLLGGLNVTLTGGFPKSAPTDSFLTQLFGAESWTGFGWCIVVIVAMHLLLTRTRWGLHTFATGGNFIGAREAGVRVNRIKIGNFILCAVLGGFVGILEAFRIDSIDPLAGGPNNMFLAVAAAVIGGTALAGGIGTIIGAFLGAAVISILQNGFTLQGVSAYTFNIILGLAILVAMTLNVYIGSLRRSGRR
ncbi:MAG: ABC transporter permease [Actinobacteria bacterium]|nr:ABC transporter permease [Actinomycetota bacterium]